MELNTDANGIWTDNVKNAVDYPDIGNNNSFTLEEESFWFSHRNNILVEVMKRFPFKANFADIGGGNGFQARFVADHLPVEKVFLIEPGYNGCLNARRRGLENVYNVVFEKFDFQKHNVTAVGMFDVIEHIEKDCEFLQKLKSKLPEKSLVYITVPTYNFLWSDVDDLGKHHRRYNSKMILQLSDCAGLKLLYSSYFFSYLPPLTFFLRSLPYRLKGKRRDDAMLDTEKDQHNPSSAVLKVFNYFEKYELKKIKNSRVAFGASAIAVMQT